MLVGLQIKIKNAEQDFVTPDLIKLPIKEYKPAPIIPDNITGLFVHIFNALLVDALVYFKCKPQLYLVPVVLPLKKASLEAVLFIGTRYFCQICSYNDSF